jgi:hypothetical protein
MMWARSIPSYSTRSRWPIEADVYLRLKVNATYAPRDIHVFIEIRSANFELKSY